MKRGKPPDCDLSPIVDVYMDMTSLAARIRKDAQVAEWERLEREDEARPDFVPSFVTRWNGEYCRGVALAADKPTDAESAAFLAYEREHLGIDRCTGELAKLSDVTGEGVDPC